MIDTIEFFVSTYSICSIIRLQLSVQTLQRNAFHTFLRHCEAQLRVFQTFIQLIVAASPKQSAFTEQLVSVFRR